MKISVLPVFKIDIGDRVICDNCNLEFTDSDESGGFLFQSKAICPHCAPKYLASVIRFDEQRFIRARCPNDVSFRDFILAIRKA